MCHYRRGRFGGGYLRSFALLRMTAAMAGQAPPGLRMTRVSTRLNITSKTVAPVAITRERWVENPPNIFGGHGPAC